MKKFTSEAQKIGELGENVAAKFLMKHGFSVVERNYTKKWGEIDIIAEKRGVVYFIEVKSQRIVSRETSSEAGKDKVRVNWTQENMTVAKRKKLSRTIEILLKDKRFAHKDFKIGVVFVSL